MGKLNNYAFLFVQFDNLKNNLIAFFNLDYHLVLC